MKILCVLVGFLLAQAAAGQYRVRFMLDSVPPAHQQPVFIAGSFNGWNPGQQAFRFGGGSFSVTLDAGRYEYKLTRGSWQAAEATAQGGNMPNRTLHLTSDTVVHLSVAAWADDFAQPPKRTTALPQVCVLDSAFFIPQLNRHRRISVYVPQGYARTHRRYPVLYMQDGQNVFDDSTSFAGEWNVDETLAALPDKAQSIVVAIDNGGDTRLNEYAPYDGAPFGIGQGAAYADFLAHTLKPYIHKRFRVKRGRRHTAIAGSSMGALISFYTMLRYPKAFGSAGVFSPSFWIAPALKDDIAKYAPAVRGRIYFYAGKAESNEMVPDMLAVFEQMAKISKVKMTTVIRTDGHHDEARWRVEFPLFYAWLMH